MKKYIQRKKASNVGFCSFLFMALMHCEICHGGNVYETKISQGAEASTKTPIYVPYLEHPKAIAVDKFDNIYVSDQYGIYRISIETGSFSEVVGGSKCVSQGDRNGDASVVCFGPISGIAVDGSGNIYASELNNIRKITPAGKVSTLLIQASSGGSGLDGPVGIAIDNQSALYVADSNHNEIKKIYKNGQVSVLAGSIYDDEGGGFSVDGNGKEARFYSPEGISVDDSGNIFIAEAKNQVIRKITPSGAVTTIAGKANSAGFSDGPGQSARLNNPAAIAIDHAGNIYIADRFNRIVRKISPSGFVSTLAGKPGVRGFIDGKNSQFSGPAGIAINSKGMVYVTDLGNNSIREIMPAGSVITLVVGKK